MTDLGKEFENELDLADAFEAEEEYVAPTLAQKVETGLTQQVESLAPAVQTGGNLVKTLGESALDIARGVGKGLTLNSIDELGGLVSAGAESLYNKFNPTDSALREQGFQIAEPSMEDLYRENQQSIQKELEMSADRSPVLDIAGQIGGGMASGSILGSALGLTGAAQKAQPLLDIAKNQGKVKAGIELLKRGGTSYAKALPVIGLEGALSSKEGSVMTPEGRSQLAEDATGAALFGLPAVLGLQAATDIVGPAVGKASAAVKSGVQNTIEESPLLRQMRASYDYGAEGINPRSTKVQLSTELGKTNLAELDNSRVQSLMQEISKMDQQVGKAVGDSLERATAAGKTINIAGEAKQALDQLQNIANKFPELAENTNVQRIYGKIAETGNITPSEANELIKYVDSYAAKFNNPADYLQKDVRANLLKTRKDFSAALKTAVPEYAQAAERMQSFRTLVPETILARNKPVEVVDDFYGNLRDKDEKMFDALKAVLQGTTKSGAGAAEARTSFVNMAKGLKQFEQDEISRVANKTIEKSALERPVSAIEEQIKKYSDDAVARGAMDAITPQTGVGGFGREALFGAGAETGRSVALSASNRAGLINRKLSTMSNPVAKLGRGIYNAPDETVIALGNRLQEVPGLERYGKQLTEAVANRNNNRKNQALFTIMQNPSARAIVGTDDEEN